MGKHLILAIACIIMASGIAESVQAQTEQPDFPSGIPAPNRPGFFFSPYAPDSVVDCRGFPSGTVVKCPVTSKEFIIAQAVPLPTPKPVEVSTPAPKPPPRKKLAILNQVVLREYPIVRFRFNTTTVPVAPVVYLSQRKIDGYHIDPRLIAASKTGPVATAHDIRIALPKGERTYYFVVNVDGKPIWIDTVLQSSPKTF